MEFLPARPRGHSTSAVPPWSATAVNPRNRIISVPNLARSQYFGNDAAEYDGLPRSSFRARSQSRSPREGMGNETHPNLALSSWWSGTPTGKDESNDFMSRLWNDSPKMKIPPPVPEAQMEGWAHTRQRVTQAAVAILGTTGDVAHDVLASSIEVLDFVPIAGLAPAAKALLSIWDALQLVGTNRTACLRLTERCAEILLSVRQEVREAGDTVGTELAGPIEKLIGSFSIVHTFLQKLVHRPFLKRYLKRDEILSQIRACDAALGEALEMFGLSIQVRILRELQDAERRRAHDTQVLTQLLSVWGAHSYCVQTASGLLPSGPGLRIATPPSPSPRDTDIEAHAADTPLSPSSLPPAEVLPKLRTLHRAQDTADTAQDMADLRGLMRAALETNSDVEMLGVLQIGRTEMPEAIRTLQRALEQVVEGERLGRRRGSVTGGSPGGIMGRGVAWSRDALDRQFIEGGIDALQRMSGGVEKTLPSWTITPYEVDLDEKIGMGFFSDVYKGTWQGRTVAIKVLAESTPRSLFIREAGIWKELRHENVLALYGASSACGDPPWFFVCPYAKNGSLVEFLKRGRDVAAATEGSEGRVIGQDQTVERREGDLFRFMLEIAKGMEYLHKNGVLHGDLKAANVLVDDELHCVISDFGQSEMKSEAYRISGTPPPHGTLRWQAPELMSGLSQLSLAPSMDVYAFAISCVEILMMGRIPWPLMDDDAVRHFVLRENKRPALPVTQFNTPLLQELLRVCWHFDPTARPSFEKIVVDMVVVRESFFEQEKSAIRNSVSLALENMWGWQWDTSGAMGLCAHTQHVPSASMGNGTPPDTYRVFDASPVPTASDRIPSFSQREDFVVSSRMHMPDPMFYAPFISPPFMKAARTHSRADSDGLGLDFSRILPESGELSTPSQDGGRYRLLLGQFHSSRTFPLWVPSPVILGAVGYLSKTTGMFVTLFNAFNTEKSTNKAVRGLPSLARDFYSGREKRNAAQRGWDAFLEFLTFNGKDDTSAPQHRRRNSFPFRTSQRTPPMTVGTSPLGTLMDYEAPKKWYKANANAILQIFGPSDHIQLEDLFLVIDNCGAFEDTADPPQQPNHGSNSNTSLSASRPWSSLDNNSNPLGRGRPSYFGSIPEIPLSDQQRSLGHHGAPRCTPE